MAVRAAKFGGFRTKVRPTAMDLLGSDLPLKGGFGARIDVLGKINVEQSTRVIGFEPRHIRSASEDAPPPRVAAQCAQIVKESLRICYWVSRRPVS